MTETSQTGLELTSVTFLQGWRGYAAGDVAGFKPYKAKELVSEGFAEFNKKKKTRKKLNDVTEDRQGMKGHAIEK